MSKRTTDSMVKSSPEWDELEDWLRGSIQKLIQETLEEEVTGFFGRVKSARRSEEDSDSGYRNGYARPRKLALSGGTIELKRPRVRNTEERFESRLLPLFARRTAKVADLIPQLYLHGLSEGDFDLALRGLLGEDAPLSAAMVARLKDRWNGELADCHPSLHPECACFRHSPQSCRHSPSRPHTAGLRCTRADAPSVAP